MTELTQLIIVCVWVDNRGNFMKLANEIVELFEELLNEKGIEIPCEDSVEQNERYAGGNEAKLYGTEYWNLVDEVESLIDFYNNK